MAVDLVMDIDLKYRYIFDASIGIDLTRDVGLNYRYSFDLVM